MVTAKRKVLSYILSFVMAFTVFGVFGVSQANAESDPVFMVTVTYDNDGDQTVGFTKEYTQAEMEALADVGNDELYMWQNNKNGYLANVYRVQSGILLETLLADNDLSANAADAVRMYAVDKDTGEVQIYEKFEYKDTIIGPNYVYPDAYYHVNAETGEGATVYGEPVEVKPVLALDYGYSVGGLTGNAEIPAKELVDMDFDTNRVFTGMSGTDDFGGMKSISKPVGMDVVMEADESVELLNGETINFISDDESLPIELPTVYGDKIITGWSYLNDQDEVVDLGLVTTGAALAAAGGATIFPTPKTSDDAVLPPTVSSVKATVAKKAMTVKFTSEGDAAGYQIAYKVKGTSKWKYTSTTSKSKKIKSLKKGKRYNVKIRGFYYTPKQAKEYGEWSAAITTKKIK